MSFRFFVLFFCALLGDVFFTQTSLFYALVLTLDKEQWERCGLLILCFLFFFDHHLSSVHSFLALSEGLIALFFLRLHCEYLSFSLRVLLVFSAFALLEMIKFSLLLSAPIAFSGVFLKDLLFFLFCLMLSHRTIFLKSLIKS